MESAGIPLIHIYSMDPMISSFFILFNE
uniref:Uncharacterized protein n=1 Tax=Anguilla anguilla TaxID=7936 RepID=A0A0E9W701_ANGAN